METVLQVQIAQHREDEQPEPDRTEGNDDRLDRTDAHDSLECCLHRRRGGWGIRDDLSENALLFELAAGWLFNPKGDDGDQQYRNRQNVESPAPTIWSTHGRRDKSNEERAESRRRA